MFTKHCWRKKLARVCRRYSGMRSNLTVCVTGVWAGWDSLREQKKLEARKILENAAESHPHAEGGQVEPVLGGL